METNDSDTVIAKYTYGNDLISMNNEQLATINYYHYDGIGSTRQITDDTETVVASYTYDAFGNVVAQTTGGMAYHTPEDDTPINPVGITNTNGVNTAGLVFLLCFVSRSRDCYNKE